MGHARGDVEVDGGVLIIKRIHLTMTLLAAESVRPVVERVHGVYADRCPVYRTLKDSIQITSSVEIAADARPAA